MSGEVQDFIEATKKHRITLKEWVQKYRTDPEFRASINTLLRGAKRVVLSLLTNPTMFTKEEIEKAVKTAVIDIGGNYPMWFLLLTNPPKDMCGRCGKCCQNADPIMITPGDIAAMRAYLGMALSMFMEQYVETKESRFQEEPILVFKGTPPCPFLRGKNRCTIYEARPVECQAYPFALQFSGDPFQPGCTIPAEVAGHMALGFLVRKRLPPTLQAELDTQMKQFIEDLPDPKTTDPLEWSAALVKKIREQRSR